MSDLYWLPTWSPLKLWLKLPCCEILWVASLGGVTSQLWVDPALDTTAHWLASPSHLHHHHYQVTLLKLLYTLSTDNWRLNTEFAYSDMWEGRGGSQRQHWARWGPVFTWGSVHVLDRIQTGSNMLLLHHSSSLYPDPHLSANTVHWHAKMLSWRTIALISESKRETPPTRL